LGNPQPFQVEAPPTQSAGSVRIALTPGSVAVGGQVTVSGTVLTAAGAAEAGATVYVAVNGGAPVTTQTGPTGAYTLQIRAPATAGPALVSASVLGMAGASAVLLVTARGVSVTGSPQSVTLTTPPTTPVTTTIANSGGQTVARVGVVGLTGTLTVADYASNPAAAVPVTFQSAGGFFDVSLANAVVSSQSQLTISACSGVTAGDVLYWLDGNAWTPVTPAAGTRYTFQSPCLSVTLDAGTSSPRIGQLTGTVFAAGAAVRFSDVPSTYWAYPYISELTAKGIVNGFPDGTFQPNGPTTRAQFVKMLDLTLGLPVSTTSVATPFTDVPANAWYAPYVAIAVKEGIVQGLTPSTFGPNVTLTREQMAVLLARALHLTQTTTLHFSDAGQIDAWAVPGVEEAVAAGYIAGFPNGTIQPLGPATRAEAAKVLALVLKTRTAATTG
jgi:hypothetical protein